MFSYSLPELKVCTAILLCRGSDSMLRTYIFLIQFIKIYACFYPDNCSKEKAYAFLKYRIK
jgi:hypothetical protein